MNSDRQAKMNRFAICALMVSAPSLPAVAGSPATMLMDDSHKRLLIYDSECGVDAAPECALASLDCVEYDRLSVSIDGLEDQDVARWLTKKGGLSLPMKGIRAGSELYATEILRSDLDFTWSVIFIASRGDARPWVIIDGSPNVVAFEAITGTLSVSITGETKSDFEKFVAACR
jgi:hypothetical protein